MSKKDQERNKRIAIVLIIVAVIGGLYYYNQIYKKQKAWPEDEPFYDELLHICLPPAKQDTAKTFNIGQCCFSDIDGKQQQVSCKTGNVLLQAIYGGQLPITTPITEVLHYMEVTNTASSLIDVQPLTHTDNADVFNCKEALNPTTDADFTTTCTNTQGITTLTTAWTSAVFDATNDQNKRKFIPAPLSPSQRYTTGQPLTNFAVCDGNSDCSCTINTDCTVGGADKGYVCGGPVGSKYCRVPNWTTPIMDVETLAPTPDITFRYGIGEGASDEYKLGIQSTASAGIGGVQPYKAYGTAKFYVKQAIASFEVNVNIG